MWILRTDPEAQVGPFTFRLLPGVSKTLGRAGRADFIVDVVMVSRVHCRLTVADGQLRVDDLSSTNGTFVNDRRVDGAALAAGDRLRVGRLELVVSHGS